MTTQTPSSNQNKDIIDTSGMVEGKAAAMDVAEAARDQTWSGRTFAKDIFMGNLDFSNVFPFPDQPEDDIKAGDAFLTKFNEVLRDTVDPNEIDKSGEIPDAAFKAIADIKGFAIKIPTEYDGLGLSQTNYLRAGQLMGSHCASTAALVSAHQSIGVPQPLLMFGTDAQKKQFLPRFAKGAISAFALTEVNVGSDPAKLETTAELSEDGKNYVINGEKLWCTNGTRADVIVVMVRTPDKEVRGRMRRQISAIIVEMNTPGVTVVRRCRFMGLKALYNAVIEFKDVKVPAENLLLEEGRGLKIALSTLNTGRLTMSGSATGISKRCLKWVKDWSNSRVQWGVSIGQHSAIADKVAKIAADVFAMESISLLTARLVDLKQADIRLESAMCKMKTSEDSERIIDDTMQIRGGRGFETEDSQRARNEPLIIPIERTYRDCRINTIFEGSSEIMRLLIAREALDRHLTVAGDAINTKLPSGDRFKGAMRAAGFYAGWYPLQWLPLGASGTSGLNGLLKSHVNRAGRTSHRLARVLFHQMAKHGPKLETKHITLKRIVDIGTELFTIAATCSRAHSLYTKTNNREYLDIADLYCKNAFDRISEWFDALANNHDDENYTLAQRLLDDEFNWIFEGIVD